LKVLIDWPASLLTWDILFLLPVPWVAPVLAPAAVALTMVVAGVLSLAREAAGRPVELNGWHWTALVVGGLILVASFCWDARNVAVGGIPAPYPWALFLVGEGVAVAGFLHAFHASADKEPALSLGRLDQML
jgi:hypothetical protein